MIDDKREIPAGVVGVDITYEVHLKSNGSKSVGFREGAWFQATPFIDRQFQTYDEAMQKIMKYELSGKYRYLDTRVVQVTTAAVVI
jgi:hypothetical protein